MSAARTPAVLLTLVLAACASVEHGTVTDKRWYDEYTTVLPVYTYDGQGRVTGFYLQEVFTPACWQVWLRNGDDTGSLCVEPDAWMRAEIGGQYP